METTFRSMKCEVYVEARKVEEAVSFYEKAFGAERLISSTIPNIKPEEFPWLVSIEIEIGSVSIVVTDVDDYDSYLFADDYFNEYMPMVMSDTVVSGGAVFWLGTSDVKAAVDKAVKAGAVEYFLEDEGPLFGGHEVKLKDPYGIVWVIKRVANVEPKMTTEVSNEGENTVMLMWAKRQVYVESMKVDEAVAFYQKAFGAERLISTTTQLKRDADPPELPSLLSIEIQIGSLCIIVTDADYNDNNIIVPDDYDYKYGVKTRVVFCLETSDVQAAVDKAVKAGAVAFSEYCLEDEGSLLGGQLMDPYGIVWVIKRSR